MTLILRGVESLHQCRGGSGRHQLYARYTLPCPGKPEHDWWGPLLPVQGDCEAGFNRSEYVSAIPSTSERHRRLYGMRQDHESEPPRGGSVAVVVMGGAPVGG